MRRFLLVLLAIAAAGTAAAEDVTLPAAASIVGGAPFFSDVRAFNTSYTDDLTVEARYRCFIPSPCNPTTTSVTFTLTPRQSLAFNDMVVSQFNAPDTAGGIEFIHSGGSDQLVITSRLYSTAPTPTVGMFIPGLPNSEAHDTTVLTSIRNGSFRTNVGVFNREDSSTNVTFRIFDGGAQVGADVTRSVAGHSGLQVNGIFNVAGDANHTTDNAVIVVSADHEVFSYAAVIDNATTDPIFVVGAQDEPFQVTTPSGPTATPNGPTVTPTQPAPTVTPTPPAGATFVVKVGQGGDNFVDQTSGSGTTTIHVGDTVRWEWVGSNHSSTSGDCPPCNASGDWNSNIKNTGQTFEHTFSAAGNVNYFCTVHDTSMTGTVVVNP